MNVLIYIYIYIYIYVEREREREIVALVLQLCIFKMGSVRQKMCICVHFNSCVVPLGMGSNSRFCFGSADYLDLLSSDANGSLIKPFISPHSFFINKKQWITYTVGGQLLIFSWLSLSLVKMTNITRGRLDQQWLINVNSVTAEMKTWSVLWLMCSLPLGSVFSQSLRVKTHRSITPLYEWEVRFCISTGTNRVVTLL